MATVNYSVPDDVRDAFDRTFKGKNKSAVIADLMRRAVAEADLEQRRMEFFRVLTERRSERPSATDEETRAARCAGRQ